MIQTRSTSNGQVTTADQGAHLVEWRVDDVPVIWISSESAFEQGRAIRGGIPICWPWFGPGRTGDLEPAHGFARIAPWRLVADGSGDGVVDLAWELTNSDVEGVPGAEKFPPLFTARYSVRVDAESTTATLTVRNDDGAPCDYEVALHSYLHVGDIRQVTVAGLSGATYYDKVLQSEAEQTGDLTLTGETDRVFTSSGAVEIRDPVLHRTLVIEKAHSPTTVVWNPWVEKAAAMSDFANDEWTQMICVEAAATGTHAVQLPAGREHALSTTVRIVPLDG